MNCNIEQQTEKIRKKHRAKKIWHSVVGVLACITVFCTTYALVIPAITMTDEVYCGLDEHPEHTDECYELVPVCGYADSSQSDYGAELICGQAEGEHIHADSCYSEHRELICSEAEHVHDDACYETQQVIDADGNIADELVLACQVPEHVHSDSCYVTWWELTCGDEEHTHSSDCYPAGSTDGETHQHTEACYEKRLICEKDLHTHTLQCSSNPDADVESSAIWERTFADVTLTGNWNKDVLAIAETQLGYSESERNYLVDEDGVTLHGYTRYGAWYGEPYGDWNAMFVSFCLHYAGVPDNGEEPVVPQNNNCRNWVEWLRVDGLYRDSRYSPTVGDLVFFDSDQDGLEDHVGIVSSRVCGKDGLVQSFSAIEGDVEDHVVLNTYSAYDGVISGYCALPISTQLQPDESTNDLEDLEDDRKTDDTKKPDEVEDVEGIDNPYAPMDSSGEKVTVDTCNLTLTLNLSWPDGNNPELTVYLVNQATGERLRTITMDRNSKSKAISFTNLPRVDADWNEISYGVELEKVSGYVGGYTLDTSDTTNSWDENSTLWVKVSSIQPGKSYLLLTSDNVGPGNSQFIRASSTITPKEMLSENVALSSGPITAADGNAYAPYLKADADGIGGALWTAAKKDDGFSFCSNYLTENNMSGYYLATASSLDQKATKCKFDSKSQTISAGKDKLYPFEKVDPIYGTVRTVNMSVSISYVAIGQAEKDWQEYTTIRVVKQWQDANGNPITGGLPESLKVTLTADGIPASLQDAEVTLTADNNWTHEWSVPRYSFDSGLKHEIQYSVQEEAIDGFTQSDVRSEDIYGDPITAWVLTDDFEDNTEFILTTSPGIGTVGALTAAQGGAHWADGNQSKVNVKSGSLQVNGVTYSQYITDPGANVIWKTGTGETKSANQHGTHKMWTLYSDYAKGYLKNNGQGDISSDVKQECWFYYNWYTGTPGKRPPSNPSSEWSNVLGSYNDYFLLSNNHTGDGGSTTAQTFWLYKKVEAQPVVHQITLVNNQHEAGYELPETGGTGTHMYAIGGLLLTAGSLLYLGCMKYRRERRFSA